MAYEIVVSQHAQDDLDQALGYLIHELKNPPAALHLLEAVEKVYARLGDHPQVYGLCQQPLLARRGFRKAVVGGYVLIYRVNEGSVYIQRFFSDLQDYEAKL